MTKKVSTKLLVAFSVVLLLTVIAGLFGLELARQAHSDTQQMYDEEIVGLGQLSELNLVINNVRRLGLTHVLEPTAEGKATLEGGLRTLVRRAEAEFDTLAATWADDPQKLESLEDVRDDWNAYTSLRDRTLALSREATPSRARTFTLGPTREAFDQVSDGLTGLVRINEARASDRIHTTREDFSDGRRFVIFIIVVAVVTGLLTAFVMAKRIAQRLGEVAAAAQALEAGDLTRRANVRSGDEVEDMATAFNAMAERLERALAHERATAEALQTAVREYGAFAAKVAEGDLTVRATRNGNGELRELADGLNGMVAQLGDLSGRIREGAQRIGASSSEILAAVSHHTASATEQSAAISQTSTTVDELRASGEHVIGRAREVADRAARAAEAGDDGKQAVAAIVEGMDEIKGRVGAISQGILELSEQTRQIGEITATVDELADRSNLLALNATIEAAKAGEQGKGFAVVADEVRNLAEQSKQAAGQVRMILGDIQRATDATVLASEQGTRVVESGMGLAAEAGQTMGDLTATMSDASQAAHQITASTQEQKVGIDQIAQAMGDIRQTTSQFVAGVEESQSAAEDLHGLAQGLQALTEKYRV